MILSKSQLVNNINTEISDQAYGQISPYDIRHNLIDIVDSIHNLTLANQLKGINFSTFPDANTQVGEFALANISVEGSISSHNTAVGYYSLRSSYQGIKNTAIGSHSLSCNVYGEGNVAIGYQALAGNTVGHLNIGIGNFSLNNSKSGTGNIAIGHGAGYYAEKNSTYKLFIGYHPVNEEHICANPNGNGWIPLLYGDLSGIKLAIGTKSLHDDGVLQVNGATSPSQNQVYDLGSSIYKWKDLYISSGIKIGSKSINYDGLSTLSFNTNVNPSDTNSYSLGTSSKRWLNGYFKNIVANSADITYLNAINTNYFTGKTFFLNSDDIGQPQVSDDNILGGGLVLRSYVVGGSSKTYEMIVLPPSSGAGPFAGNYNATWYSNINLQVPSGSYIKTNNLISYNAPNLSNNDCFGLFFESGITYFSRKNVLKSTPSSSTGHIAGIGNINFISNSGEVNDYTFVLSSLESGVSVSQKFLTGTKSRSKDTITGKDKLSGFEIKYIDNFGNTTLNDRLVIGSYNKTPYFVNGLVLMKESTDGSVLSVTNIPNTTQNVLPNTIFNVRSKNDCVARFTTENNGYYRSAIQLVGSENCLSSGVELVYLNNSGIADINIYKNEKGINAIRITDSGTMGIFSSGIINEIITIGYSGMLNLPVISLKDNIGITNTNVVASSGYSKLYTLRNNKVFANQYNDLLLLDVSGNLFQLVVNKLDNIDGRAVFTDTIGNTFAGYQSPSGRLNINSAVVNNTSYGSRSLFDFKSGSGNISIGRDALSTLGSGNNNIVIGRNAGSGLLNSSNNIVIGNDSFKRTENLISTSGNIIIGNDGVGNSASGSFNFLLGYKENIILLEGKLGPNNQDKRLILPSGGKLYLHNNDNSESLGIRTNIIEIIDSGGTDFPENELLFKFTGNKSSDLLVLNHVANSSVYNGNWSYPSYSIGGFGGLDYNNNYWFPTSGLLLDLTPKPYAQLNGNLRLKGNIQFADGTYIGSTKQISQNTNLANSGISLANSGIQIGNSGLQFINEMFVEGFMPTGLSAPNYGEKTSGIMIIKNPLWENNGTVFVTNRDITSIVQTGAYVIAAKVNNEYRPIWISLSDTSCECCNN